MKTMNTHRLLIALAFATLALAGAARAQHRSFITRDAGPYFRTDAGASLAQDGRITKFLGGPTGGSVDYDAGFQFSAAVGYAFNKYLSVEAEFGVSGNEISSAGGFALNDTYLSHFPMLANVVFQYPIPRTRLVPYVGAGAGGVFSIFDTDGFASNDLVIYGNDDDFVFAYQVVAGLRLQLNDQMSVGVGYKYFGTDDLSFSYPPYVPGSGPNATIGIEGFRSHVITFVFQMKF